MKKGLIIGLILACFITAIIFTGLIGAITFQTRFPTTNPYITSESTVNLSYGIHAGDGLSSITHSWNGTNTTLYDYSLIGYWQFNNFSNLGESDTLIRDISLYNNNASVTGGENVTWSSSGKYGGTFIFNGKTTALIKVADNPLYNYSGNMTFCTWYKENNAYGDGLTHRLILNENGKFALAVAGDGRFSFSDWGSGNFYYDSDSNSGWNHICITYFHEILQGYLYYNGVFKVNGTSNRTGATTGNLTIGNRNSLAQPMNGSLDDLMIFNRSLSASEIDLLYKTQITKYNESYYEYNTTVNNSANAIDNFICSENSTASVFCTSIIQIKELETIKSNFSNSIGNINNNLYGSQGYTYGFASTGKMYNNACSQVSSNNYTGNREMFLNANMNILRYNVHIGNNVNSDYTINETSLGTDVSEIIKWANDNNVKISLIVDYTPNWLANITTGWCNWTTSNNSCPATDYTALANATLKLIDYVTDDGLYNNSIQIEIGNEIYSTSWLNNLTTDHQQKGIEYVKWYNSTYDVIKAKYPNVDIVPFSFTYGYGSDNSRNTTITFISNLTNKWDKLNVHQYITYVGRTGVYENNTIPGVLEQLLSICDDYSANCSEIFISEWNTDLPSSSHNTKHSATVGYSYSYILNNYPKNISSSMFAFVSAATTNTSCDSGYYHTLINSNGTTYQPYDVTKNFAHLCPAGATVYVSSNDDDTIKQVSCKKGNMYSLIVINTDTNPKNITLNMSMENGSVLFNDYLMNIENGNLFVGNIRQLGVLNSYGIDYLASPIFYINNTHNLTKISPIDTYFHSNETYFSVYNSTEKHIASTLTNNISAYVTFDVDSCNSIWRINYVSNSSIYKETWKREQIYCSGNKVTLYIQGIEPSTSSNILTLSYVGDRFTFNELAITFIILLLPILGILIIYKVVKYDLENLNRNKQYGYDEGSNFFATLMKIFSIIIALVIFEKIFSLML